MKGTLRRDAEYRALAAKVKAGTATETERLHFENWPRILVLDGGRVRLTVAPEMTLEQWKERVARSRGIKEGNIYG